MDNTDIRINETFFSESWARGYNLDPKIRRKALKNQPELKKFSPTVPTINSLEKLFKVQWSEEFEKLMRNRLAMGGVRYGLFIDDRQPFDHLSSIPKRLQRFKDTGNGEYLVDIANLCMAEFIDRNHTNFHMNSIDDDNVHSEKL